MTVHAVLERVGPRPAAAARALRRARWTAGVLAVSLAAVELLRPRRAGWVALQLEAAVVVLVLAGLALRALPGRPTAAQEGDAAVLSFPPARRRAAVAALLALGALFPGGWLAVGPGRAWAAAACALALALVALADRHLRGRVRLTPDGLRRVGGLVRRPGLRWADVTAVRLDALSRLELRSPALVERLALDLDGHADLAAQALASLPPAVLEADGLVREVLAGVAEAGRQPAPAAGARAPALVGLAGLAGVAACLACWALAARLEPRARWVLPPGWTDLSPGAADDAFAPFPPEVRTLAGAPGVVRFAAEPGGLGRRAGDQLFWAVVRQDELVPALAVLHLGEGVVALHPSARVATRRLERFGQARVAHAEVDLGGGALVLLHAAPLGRRTAVVAFTCAPAECPRVRAVAEAVLAETGGVVERGTWAWYAAPLVRAAGLAALCAGALALLLARTPAAPAGRPPPP